jgi:general L-amino acid transport system substrate-binding protein
VRKDDIQWLQIVRWTHYALPTAEELGVTRANVDAKLKSDNPAILRLLGVEGDYGKGLGLSDDGCTESSRRWAIAGARRSRSAEA